VVGIATAIGDAYADPQDKSGKSAVVDIAPVKKLPRPVTLAEVKADASFSSFPLVRIGRLSVMPVTDLQWERIVAKSDQSGASGKSGRPT
jgi:predicted RNA-binding protein with PUA-like domain